MKIALVQDELIRRGGAEQVVRCLHLAFPEAPIYTIAYQPQNTFPYFMRCDVRTSWFQKVAINEKFLKLLFFPFGIWAMKQVDVTDFDVVLLSSTHCAKYVQVSSTALVINYCHTPFRLAWNPESYLQYSQSHGLKRLAFDWIISILSKIDYKAAQRTDYFVTNAEEVKQRIQLAYHYTKPIEIIPPPVDCTQFYVSEHIGDYYLLVSRLEDYKKVDLVIEAFNELGYPLTIVGKGSREKYLKKIANKNIQFKSGLSNEALIKEYAHCRALIFPQHEDYGITPLEANASGRPVIAWGIGGVLETMIPVKEDAQKATALFFEKQDKNSIIDAIERFNTLTFDPAFIRNHAEKFHESKFIEKIKQYVLTKYAESKKG